MSKNDEQVKKLSVESYKGVRDFYPEQQAIQNYIFKIWRDVTTSFGYSEYNASILEPAELYKAKTSEEIVGEQTYTFTDRGGREVTLRPEMTPTVARMIAAKHRELSFPLRWFSIPNVFRYERPQRGRLREHWQLNADIFGVSGIGAEIEIITLAYRIMKAFGAKDDDFEIRINSRKIMFEAYKPILKDLSQWSEVCRFLDRREKMSVEEQKTGNEKYFSRSFNEDDTKKYNDNPSLVQISKALKNNGISITLDHHLMRGFDYYTDIVFEVFDTNPKNNRSLFGGGRYDNLLSLFGEEPIPAVGFGMGDVTINDFLETRGLLPTYISCTELYICHTDPKYIQEATMLANRLRNEGCRVAVDLSDKKVGDQIKSADKQKIPFIICIGEDEVKEKKYKIKNLKSRSENIMIPEEIPAFVHNNIHA